MRMFIMVLRAFMRINLREKNGKRRDIQSKEINRRQQYTPSESLGARHESAEQSFCGVAHQRSNV